jgi:two-component system cell cycle response regulator DivK
VTTPSPDAHASAFADRTPPLVLIVDDNEKNLKLHRDVLRAGGLRTLEAATAAEGIALAKAHTPDVILMDLGLPDMDGTEAARALAADAQTAHIPVVALTSLRLEDDARLRTAGFAGYLQKPISVTEFPDQVRHYCGRMPC